MTTCPPVVSIDGVPYQFERMLKEDFFSVNGLYRDADGRGQVLKISDFRFLCGFILRPLAGFMSRHELKMYRKLSDIPGIPGAGPTYGRRGFFHEYVEGHTLNLLVSPRCRGASPAPSLAPA